MSLITVSTKRNRIYPRAFDHEDAQRLHAEGMSYGLIADRFGVSYAAVERVCNPKRRERMDAQTKAWIEENRRQPCKGGCGKRVWMLDKDRSGYCAQCLARLRSAANERDGELRCTKCGEWKPDDNFAHESKRGSTGTRRGLKAHCRACETAQRRKNRKENPERERANDNNRKRKGMTMSRYLVMKQNGDGGWHEFARVEAASKEQAIEKAANSEGSYIAATEGQLSPRQVGVVTRFGIVKENGGE